MKTLILQSLLVIANPGPWLVDHSVAWVQDKAGIVLAALPRESAPISLGVTPPPVKKKMLEPSLLTEKTRTDIQTQFSASWLSGIALDFTLPTGQKIFIRGNYNVPQPGKQMRVVFQFNEVENFSFLIVIEDSSPELIANAIDTILKVYAKHFQFWKIPLDIAKFYEILDTTHVKRFTGTN